MNSSRVWIAGHNGMVGSAIARSLAKKDCEILTVEKADVDLRDQSKVLAWLKSNKPDTIFFAAAKVGGIYANNTFPADFIYDNLVIEANIINAAHLSDVNRLIFLGSSCIYPKFAPQPIPESALLTGLLEPTNEWYAIAKIAGIKLCQAYRKQYGRRYISVMPCNLYGPRDNYNLETSHVIPALIRKFHEAKASSERVVIWGTGNPLREFLHVDDLASGVIFCNENYDDYEHINCGTGEEVSIRQLAELIKEIVGFGGELYFDHTKPDGTPRKLMDSSKISSLGWRPSIPLADGIKNAYDWFLSNVDLPGQGR